MPKGGIGTDFARRLFLSANFLVRIAVLGFCALIISQAFVAAARAAERIDAVRIWPSQDYTRITLESRHPVRHSLLSVKHPARIALDLSNVDYESVAREIKGKVVASDPYIAKLRVGRYKPGVVRIVVDLKQKAKPQLFELKPVAEYGYRLVLDIYPAKPIDPLMALLNSSRAHGATSTSSGNAKTTTSRGTPAPRNRASGSVSAKARTAPPARRRELIIAVDPGHGGEDPGAHGPRGTLEKNVTLAIARKLKRIIDAQPNMRAMLTRNGDYYLSLGARVEKARRVKADLFVSIHADAYISPDARGSSVYALSERGATSAAARWLAHRENESDLIGGVNLGVKDYHLAQTLLDLSQTATIQDSIRLAHDVLVQLGRVNPLHTGRVEQAGFAVLKAPDIPSILVETAYISNPREELELRNPSYQEKIAKAIFRGVKHYLAKHPPLSRPTLAKLP